MVSVASSAFTSAYLRPAHRSGTAPSLRRGSVVHDLSGTMGRSDSRSALPRFAGALLIGFVAPSTPPRVAPGVFTPGTETGLSCSHIGSPAIPRPLRRRVLRGCISKRFTPSLAFAHRSQARLPVGPPRGGRSSRRGRLRLMLRTGELHPPAVSRRGLDPALQRQDLSERWRAATKVAWSLLWPDSHRLVGHLSPAPPF